MSASSSLSPYNFKPKYLDLVPQLPSVMKEFDQLAPEYRKSLTERVDSVRKGQSASVLFDDPNYPRPLYISPNDTYIAFMKQKKGDRCIGKGLDKKLYYVYGVQTKKVHVLESIKGVAKDIETELQIAKAINPDVNIEGVVMRSTKHIDFDFKGCVISKRFDGSVEEAMLSGVIPLEATEVVLKVLRQLAIEMIKVDEAGYVHRDVKLANFILKKKKNGEFLIRIIDFAFAILKTNSRPDRSGSYLYKAPEVIVGEAGLIDRSYQATYLTEKMDSWALAMDIANLYVRQKMELGILASPSRLKEFLERFGHDNTTINDIPPLKRLLGQLVNLREEWITRPEGENVLEYALWNLLRVDIQKRWSARGLLDFLTPAAARASSSQDVC